MKNTESEPKEFSVFGEVNEIPQLVKRPIKRGLLDWLNPLYVSAAVIGSTVLGARLIEKPQTIVQGNKEIINEMVSDDGVIGNLVAQTNEENQYLLENIKDLKKEIKNLEEDMEEMKDDVAKTEDTFLELSQSNLDTVKADYELEMSELKEQIDGVKKDFQDWSKNKMILTTSDDKNGDIVAFIEQRINELKKSYEEFQERYESKLR